MSDGIPIVYYGQEQGFRGAADPVSIFVQTSTLSDLLSLVQSGSSLDFGVRQHNDVHSDDHVE